MKKIRLNRIYSYYFASARDMVDELRRVKELYCDGEMSYNRARKRMDYLVRQIQWRCEVCFGVASIHREQTTAYCVLKNAQEVVAWMAE